MMQATKDTFYAALHNRLATLDPDRTVVVRGALRPAVLVEENELPMPDPVPDGCYMLRWTDPVVDMTEPMPLVQLLCEIRYRCAGTRELAGMDRGRMLAGMDATLEAMLHPRTTAAQVWTDDVPIASSTQVFWSEPQFNGSASAADGSLMRTVRVQVFSLWEAGEA